MSQEFHEIALKSILFKGRSDIYFCYLKSEKIAHVLTLLYQNSAFKDKTLFVELLSLACRLPHTILYFVAGDIDAAMVLADTLSTLSLLRLTSTQGFISKENAKIISEEYENIVRKIAAENHPSPFVSSKDFSVEEVKITPVSPPLFERELLASPQKDNESKRLKDTDKGHTERASLILDFVRQNKGVSIKEIAAVVKGYSEKTIQRELALLIEVGLVERRGERRWSVYVATPKK
jgi:DNA-binding transcriptional ArsR family regulator